MKNLGNHIDVSYNHQMFGDSSSSDEASTTATGSTSNIDRMLSATAAISAATATNTNWSQEFFSLLNPVAAAAAAATATGTCAGEDPVNDAYRIALSASLPSATVTSTKTRTAKTTTTKKRKRKPRPDIQPDIKEYVEPQDMDILLGRGGKSNHHPGNKRYREEIENFKTAYTSLTTKDDKTDLTRQVVEYILHYGGRFLELDKTNNLWYLIPDAKARRKVSQALREDVDPTKRREKRARFLEKKRKKQMGLV